MKREATYHSEKNENHLPPIKSCFSFVKLIIPCFYFVPCPEHGWDTLVESLLDSRGVNESLPLMEFLL